jgi:hypothetical protein
MREGYNAGMIVTILAALLGVSLNAWAGPQPNPRTSKATTPQVTVYRVKTCGCCGKWAEHMKQAGFNVTVNVVEKVDDVDGRNRVPERLRSCHVAFVDQYVVEGHVPADVIKDLLAKRPSSVDGLAVPGMPLGSPGMESPTPQRYEIIAFDKKGMTTVFAKR